MSGEQSGQIEVGRKGTGYFCRETQFNGLPVLKEMHKSHILATNIVSRNPDKYSTVTWDDTEYRELLILWFNG